MKALDFQAALNAYAWQSNSGPRCGINKVERKYMKLRHITLMPLLVIGLGTPLFAQQDQGQTIQTTETKNLKQKHGRSPGGDVASGTGDIGKGAAGAAGHAAAGAGKGAADLVTLHPIDAAGNVGKGAAY